MLFYINVKSFLMKIPIISAPYKRTSVQKDVGGLS